MRPLWPWIGVPLILAGCLYHYRYAPHAGSGASLDRSESSPDLVEVVTTEEVDRPYRKIGIVHAPASLPERDAIVALKRRARTLGGDALLDVRRRGSGSTADRDSSGLAAAPWEASVIVWTDAKTGGRAHAAGKVQRRARSVRKSVNQDDDSVTVPERQGRRADLTEEKGASTVTAHGFLRGTFQRIVVTNELPVVNEDPLAHVMGL